MRVLVSVVALAAVLVAPVIAQEQSWVGKTIFIKKAGIKIGQSDNSGKQVYVATLREAHYSVLAEESGRIKVKTDKGITGWFDKADAVALDDAVAYFTQRILAKPNDFRAYFLRASARVLTKDLDGAIEDLTESLRLKPSKNTYYNRGRAWAKKGDNDKAIADFSEAIRICELMASDPKMGLGTRILIAAFDAKKEADAALAEFRQTIVNPDWAAFLDARGSIHARKKDYDKALADFDKAARLDPKNDYPIAAMAWILATAPDAKVRDGKRAVELAKKALNIDPTCADHMDTLAAAHAEVGDFEEAVRFQERAMRSPDLVEPSGARRRLELYRKMQPYRQK